MTQECLLCGEPDVELLLDLGQQPVASHYLRSAADAFVEYPLALAFCRGCGLAQLREPFPYRALVPRFDWIAFREPERHLDAVVDKICRLPGIDAGSIIAGVSSKDRTTLERFARRGFGRFWSVDPGADLGAQDPRANVESIQALLTPERAASVVARRGPADVLIVRHILEHAAEPSSFLQALGALVRDGGYIVIEVPDCERNLMLQDYTMLWEEHALYFTARTFGGVMPFAHCTSLEIESHPYIFENCLVQIGRKSAPGVAAPAASAPLAADLSMLRLYAQRFPIWTEATRRFLTNESASDRGVALYGAGHLSAAFVNFHGLADQVAFVVDDLPDKQGLFLPKSGLPIIGRKALDARRTPLCLFAFAPESEAAVAASHQRYLDEGGRFYSIFATSGRSFRPAIDGMGPAPVIGSSARAGPC